MKGAGFYFQKTILGQWKMRYTGPHLGEGDCRSLGLVAGRKEDVERMAWDV